MIESPPPLVSVLIVNFNSTPLLRRCLSSLAASTIAHRLEVIVVDNASYDFDAEALLRDFPWVKFLPQTTNTTWTGGNNLAFASSSAPLALLLNPDTEVEPEALENAVGHFQKDPGLVGIGGYLIGPDGQVQRYHRRLPTLRDIPVIFFEPLFRRTRRGRRYLMLDEPLDRPLPVPQPAGAFLMFRRHIIEEPLLDPGYLNFMSDVALARELSSAGRVMLLPDVRLTHRRGGAGVADPDPVVRLRLYADLAWGVRRYMGQLPPVAAAYLTVLGLAFLSSRLMLLAWRSPSVIRRGQSAIVEWLRHRPPSYTM